MFLSSFYKAENLGSERLVMCPRFSNSRLSDAKMQAESMPCGEVEKTPCVKVANENI